VFLAVAQGVPHPDDRGPWAVMLPWLTMVSSRTWLVLTIVRDVSLIGSLALSAQATILDSRFGDRRNGADAGDHARRFFYGSPGRTGSERGSALADLPKELEGFTSPRSATFISADDQAQFRGRDRRRVNRLNAD